MDDMAAMAEALISLHDNARREAYAEKAKARARDFTAPAAAQRYWQVIRAVLAERNSGGEDLAHRLHLR